MIKNWDNSSSYTWYNGTSSVYIAEQAVEYDIGVCPEHWLSVTWGGATKGAGGLWTSLIGQYGKNTKFLKWWWTPHVFQILVFLLYW